MGFNPRYAGKIHQQIIKGKSGGADNVSIPAMRVRYIMGVTVLGIQHRVVSIPAMRVRYISKNNGKHYH